MQRERTTKYSALKTEKQRVVTRWVALLVMTYVYLVGELSHFLLGIVSRPMSQELHYGDHACLPNPAVDQKSKECRTFKNASSCDDLREDDNTTTCVWDYSGLGLDYQLLAGPAFVAVFTTSGIIIGVMADKFNRKMVVTVCCALVTLGTGVTGAAVSYWQLVALRMLTGMGESAFTPVCSSMLSDLFSESAHAMALGIFNWGIYIGYGLSYAVGNFVTAADILDMGWRWSYIITGIMGIVATLLLLLLVKDPPRGSQVDLKESCEKPTDSTATDPERETHSTRKENQHGLEKPEESSQSTEQLLVSSTGIRGVYNSLKQPAVIVLAIAACLRHTAGFSWAYNTQLYFLTYYPDFDIGLWVTGCSIIGGSFGVAVGGVVSDRLMKRIGLRSRLYVLAGSQLLATPFAAGTLYFPPPGAFFSLFGAYMFAEMWFGVLFAVLLELVSGRVQATALAVFLFVMNNVGGNLPVVVDPLTDLFDYRTALLIMYPGGYLSSAIIFFLTSFLL